MTLHLKRYWKYNKSKLKVQFVLSKFRCFILNLLYFWYPLRCRVIQPFTKACKHEPRVLSCGSTLNICQGALKSANLLYKQVVVKTLKWFYALKSITHTSQNFLQVLGSVGALPDILIELEVSYYLLRRLLGVRIEGDKKAAKVQKLSKNEVLMVNIGSLSTGGRVIAVKADLAKIGLTTPVCTSVGEKIALSRRVEKHWRLIGWGQIRNGAKVTPTTA